LILFTIQEEYKDKNGTIIGLGFDYRESLELSLGRLFSLLNLDSGKVSEKVSPITDFCF
jgi:hypothetical protein